MSVDLASLQKDLETAKQECNTVSLTGYGESMHRTTQFDGITFALAFYATSSTFVRE